jgi:hypothetical protein
MAYPNILVFTVNSFSFTCGGLVVQYELCRMIDSMGINIRMMSPENIPNSIFSKFYQNDFDLNNTLVIYGETIEGNPLNAPYVMRWILAPLGIIVYNDIYKTWGKNDLVYYFNEDKSFENYEAMVGTKYKLLTSIYINPLIKNYNDPLRKGYCHTFRKSQYHTTLRYAHPPNSFEIKREHKLVDCINIFNKREIFICYDPLTFLNIMAAMCGCVSVVIKVDGVPTHYDWLKTTAVGRYVKDKKIERLYGIAYGIDEIGWAKETLHLVSQQWLDILEHCKSQSILPFLKDIEDLNNIKNAENTIQKIFFSEGL